MFVGNDLSDVNLYSNNFLNVGITGTTSHIRAVAKMGMHEGNLYYARMASADKKFLTLFIQ
jgi:hypothetical protein